MRGNQDAPQSKCAIVAFAANGGEDTMNNRSGRPGLAGLLPAAILAFRITFLGLMLIRPAVALADDQQGSKPAPTVGTQVPGNQVPGKPGLVLSLAPYDQLWGGFIYLARLAGQDEAAEQLDRLIAVQTGDRGLGGIDRKKPIGAYGWVGSHGDDSSLVMLVPVADEQAFLDLLGNFNIAPRKGGDGVYSAGVERVPDPIYFRFASGYAYVTARNRSVLDEDRLLAPAAVLARQGCVGSGDAAEKKSGSFDPFCPNPEPGILSLIVNIDRIPTEFKDLAVGELDRQLADAKERNAPLFETEWQRKFRLETIDEITGAIRTLLYEGGETSLHLDLDRKAGDVVLTVGVEGKPGSAMAAAIQALEQATSTTAGLLRKDAAMNGTLSFTLPEKLHELYVAMLDDGRRQALANAKTQIERTALTTAFEAFMPTLKAAELDWTFNLLGPGSDGLYTFTGGVKVRDGARLEKIFRETPPKDPTTDIRLDVEKVGPVGIHGVTVRMDDAARRVFGDNPVYLAFRDDALLFAVGARGLEFLKEALAVAPATGKTMELQIAASRLAPLAKERVAQDIARDVFGDDRDGDRIRLTLGGGKTLTLRLSMTTKLIEYTSRIGRAIK
jgi:hypothetical protein